MEAGLPAGWLYGSVFGEYCAECSLDVKVARQPDAGAETGKVHQYGEEQK